MIKSVYFEQIQITTPLAITPHNARPYLDVAKDMDVKKNGLFTFVLRVDNGDIVDYTVIENISPK